MELFNAYSDLDVRTFDLWDVYRGLGNKAQLAIFEIFFGLLYPRRPGSFPPLYGNKYYWQHGRDELLVKLIPAGLGDDDFVALRDLDPQPLLFGGLFDYLVGLVYKFRHRISW